MGVIWLGGGAGVRRLRVCVGFVCCHIAVGVAGSAAGFEVCVRCVVHIARWGFRSAAGFDVCVRMSVCHIARWGFRSAAGFDVCVRMCGCHIAR